MKKQTFFHYFIFLIFINSFLFFSISCASGSKNEEIENENLTSSNLLTEESNSVSESQTEAKIEWYIYNKTPSNVLSGPFDTINEVLSAWLGNSKIKAKGKYFIGRNGVLITNNPKEYYSKKYQEAEVKYEKSKAAEEARLKAEAQALAEEKEKEKAEKAKAKAEKDALKNNIANDNPEIEEELKSLEDDMETSESPEKIVYNEAPLQEVNSSKDEYKGEIFSIPDQTEIQEKNSNSPSRYQKTYLSDFIIKDIYTIQEDQSDSEPELEKDPFKKDSKGVTELMKACQNGNDWEIKALLKAGAGINEKDNEGWTPLMYACRYQSNLSIVELLIENKADVRYSNKFVSSLVLAASYNSNPEVIKKLLEYYNPSDKEVQKAFIQLLTSSDYDSSVQFSKAKIFINYGLPVNSYYEGKTPLMYAANYCRSTKILKLLLDNKATVNIRSTEGKTAFDYAQKNMSLPRDDIFWSLNER